MSQAGLNGALGAEVSIRPDTRVDLASSSIGMAVLEGTPLPDISTPEAFVETLLAAESIGYSASVSGTYVSTELFPRLGVAEQLAPRSRRIVSERVAAVVARGEIEIGFQQVSEILSIEGAAYAGPIPEEYQRVTTFSAGHYGKRGESRRRTEAHRLPVVGRGGADDRRDGPRADCASVN